MKKSRFLPLILLLTACLLSAASEGGNEHAYHFDWTAFLGKVFNSVVLFGGLILVLRKPLIEFLSRTGMNIASDIRERGKRIEENSSNLAGVDQRLSRIEDEIERMKKTAQEGGRAEMAKLEETGRRETDRILELTATEINLRIESALKQLREKIADQTIEHFKNDIQRNLDPDIQKKIIDRNIDQIGELDEGK